MHRVLKLLSNENKYGNCHKYGSCKDNKQIDRILHRLSEIPPQNRKVKEFMENVSLNMEAIRLNCEKIYKIYANQTWTLNNRSKHWMGRSTAQYSVQMSSFFSSLTFDLPRPLWASEAYKHSNSVALHSCQVTCGTKANILALVARMSMKAEMSTAETNRNTKHNVSNVLVKRYVNMFIIYRNNKQTTENRNKMFVYT